MAHGRRDNKHRQGWIMVSWDELVVPAVSQNDNADDAHSSVIADCWEVLNDLDVGVALWNERGILLHCNAVFKDAFNANANVCRPGAAIQQMLVMSGLETGTAAREWVTEFLEAHRNSGSVEWRTRSGKWLHAQIWRRSDGHRLCNRLLSRAVPLARARWKLFA